MLHYREDDPATGIVNSLILSACAWILLILLVLILVSTVASAQIPDAPKPHTDPVEWSLLSVDASTRALDVYSTHKMIENGYHEIILPRFIADHTPVMAAYSAGTVAMDYFVTRRLEKHGHRKLAHLVTSIDICQDAPWAIRNMFLGKRTVFPSLPPGRLGTR
jgi:hypothetical protein